PQSDMYIVSIDNYLPSQSKYLSTWASKVVMTSDGGLYRFIGTSGDSYLVEAQDYGLVPKEGASVETFSAENGQGILTIKNKEFKSVNIRRQPTTKSDVIGRIKDKRGELPVVLKCLGMAEERNVNGGLEYYWYKVEVNGKTGYVREDLMMWDAVDTY
ncbi:MAG: SH3 domain-containing protein, partial [Paludibacteraceae bacterium]|nr:SH3 domain-containing protein [Paludibacteraceae bacterium]